MKFIISTTPDYLDTLVAILDGRGLGTLFNIGTAGVTFENLDDIATPWVLELCIRLKNSGYIRHFICGWTKGEQEG